jgi:hypothetical protein
MAYIGVSPSNGVRKKHTYTATASQTSFSGAGAEGITLAYRDSNYVDVYQNGVKLADEDYTATSGTAIVLAQGASADDIVEIIAFDVFSVADTVSKADGGTFDGNVTMAGAFTSLGIDDNANALAMTIDSSENVFVTKTSSDVAVVGQELRSSGFFASTRDGATVSALTRLSSDGTILEFRKDSSAVGSIGTQGGDLNIGTGACGIAFVDGVPAIYPWTTTGNITSDAAIDLGDSAGRFKDLYLSGNIYLGGTGAANALDDYEEGTFVVGITATTGTLGIGATTNNLSYTKIGQVVHFRGYINNDTFSGASGTVTITGFPFAVSDLTKFSERPAILISVIGSSDNGAKAGIMTATATTVIMQNFDASSLDSDVDLYLSGSYPTG